MGAGRKKAPGWAAEGAEQRGQESGVWPPGVKVSRAPTMRTIEETRALAKQDTESGERAMD